jgi:hypothetical protein
MEAQAQALEMPEKDFRLTDNLRRGRETAKANRDARKALGIAPPPRQSLVAMRNAIRNHCLECKGHEDAISRARNCHITKCNLYNFRPYQARP